MSQPPPPESRPEPPKTVLDAVARRTGEAPKVLLPDGDSEHGSSPLVTPGAGGAGGARPVPAGRGNYQILGQIARGGMGVILKGHDTDLGRDVALKVLDEGLAENAAIVQRFVEEAQIGGQLQHPGIVPVYELGLMADERPYFTMKLVKGRTLSALLRQRRTPADDRGRLLAIFESVCQTVAYAHSKGVIHRDLKPANVMVGAFGEVQVVDWGLAKVLHQGGVADEERARESTVTVIETVRSGPGSSGWDSIAGSILGTPAYMAPEQAQGEVEKLDARADVFALGAILCEILTGRPPYADAEGDHTVARAARAELDPARERVGACGAEAALVRLCLDCLMPARAPRPRDASEVARRVREHLSNAEERAHRAELEATAASVRARAERRAHVLTLALVGTIVAALVLGGAGYRFVQRQREEELARARAAVEAAQGESIDLARAGRPADALEAARRALALAEAGALGAAFRERARDFADEAEERLAAVRREAELEAKDAALLAELEELRLEQISTLGDPGREAELDAAFAEAFRDYGVELGGAQLLDALELFRERGIAADVALSLDDWSRLRRQMRGGPTERSLELLHLAMDLDPDPDRRRMREGMIAGDVEPLLELARPENLARLDPRSIFTLSTALWHGHPERRPDVYDMYDQALRLHPDDFVLRSVGGILYGWAGRSETAYSCWTAALALRPGSPYVRWRLAEAAFFSGRLTEALDAYREGLALDPENPHAHYGLGATHYFLGNYEEAEVSLVRSLQERDDPSVRADLLVTRFMKDDVDRAAIEDALARSRDELTRGTYAMALVDHPDPERRNPRLALSTALELQRGRGGDDRFRWIEAVACLELGDFEGGLAAVAGHYGSSIFLVISPGAIDFVRAVLHAAAGQIDVARECHARGMARWDELTAGHPEAWERSDVVRWRRRAEAALGT